jgi:hypothetical protein
LRWQSNRVENDARSATRRRNARRRRPEILLLEDRRLLSAGTVDPTLAVDSLPTPLLSTSGAAVMASAPFPKSTFQVGTTHPLSSVPALNSLPGARASLYLDFVGGYTPGYGTYGNITTPAYDRDGDPTTFSNSELASIQKIWSGVAEDYAPFNINVTTVAPSNMSHGVTETVYIGGNGAWAGGGSGGISYVGDFTNTSVPNVAFVFSANLIGKGGPGDPRYTADAASHEAGHSFGLYHQSLYSGTTMLQQYNPGPGNGTSPLMGYSYGAARSLWWDGTSSISSRSIQDDMSVIASGTNGFGYRSETVGNSAATATPLTVQNGTSVRASGIIIKPTDLDFYSVNSGPGQVTFKITVPAGVNDLAPTAELLDASGTTVLARGTASPTNFSVTLTANLAAGGSYRILVSSDGSYGNVGQYSVQGTVQPWTVSSPDSGSGTEPSAGTTAGEPPSNLSTTIVGNQVVLTWAGSASGVLGYVVERASDGVNWTTMDNSLAATTTWYVDASTVAGMTYFYRVSAVGASGVVASSTVIPATVPPQAPALLIGSASTGGLVSLAWIDVPGETGFRVERTTDGLSWTVVGATPRGVTNYIDSAVIAGTSYAYRVRGINGGGVSSPSMVVIVSTPVPATPPVPVLGLAVLSNASNRVILGWQASPNAQAYLVERSLNGRYWAPLAQLDGSSTEFVDSSVAAGRAYHYRVRSINAMGTSFPGRSVRVATPRLPTSHLIRKSYRFIRGR